MKKIKNNSKSGNFFRPTLAKVTVASVFILLVILGYVGVLSLSSDVPIGDYSVGEPLPITLFQPIKFLSRLIHDLPYDLPQFWIEITILVVYYYLFSCILIRLCDTKIIKKAKTLWRRLKYWQKGGLVGVAVSIFIFSSNITPLILCVFMEFIAPRRFCDEFTQYITLPLLIVGLGIIIGLIVGKIKIEK